MADVLSPLSGTRRAVESCIEELSKARKEREATMVGRGKRQELEKGGVMNSKEHKGIGT